MGRYTSVKFEYAPNQISLSTVLEIVNTGINNEKLVGRYKKSQIHKIVTLNCISEMDSQYFWQECFGNKCTLRQTREVWHLKLFLILYLYKLKITKARS